MQKCRSEKHIYSTMYIVCINYFLQKGKNEISTKKSTAISVKNLLKKKKSKNKNKNVFPFLKLSSLKNIYTSKSWLLRVEEDD